MRYLATMHRLVLAQANWWGKQVCEGQSFSSLMSPQSLSLSQTHERGMHLVGIKGKLAAIVLVANPGARDASARRDRDIPAARFALELFGEIAGGIHEHAGAVGEDLSKGDSQVALRLTSFFRVSNSTSDWLTDLSFLRAETSFAAEIVVTQLAPEAVGAQTSPVMRQLEHRMTVVVDVAPSEVLSVSRSSWGTACGEKKDTFCDATK